MKICLERRVNKPKPAARAVGRALRRRDMPEIPDPGYEKFRQNKRLGGGFFVKIDGEVIQNGKTIVAADEEEGVVELIVLDEQDKLVMEGNRPKRVTLHGRVEIVEYLPSEGQELVKPAPGRLEEMKAMRDKGKK
jgi:hypothetical protein